MSTATILSLAHNIRFDEAQILGLNLNVTQEILFQSYTILIGYFLYFFLYYCFSDYANNSEKFFSYLEDSKERYSDFFRNTFTHFIKILIVRNLSHSLEKQPSEEGPNSNRNILIGLENQVDHHVSNCVRKYDGEEIWHSRPTTDSFTKDLWASMSSNVEISNHMTESDLDEIKYLMISMARNRRFDLAEISYPAFNRFHLRFPEILLPVILGFLALWINLGWPYSSKMIETLKGVTSSLHSPI
ncbi:MAG: hypothetical protein ACR2QH_12465 [Geminicoccaceae bacterium]